MSNRDYMRLNFKGGKIVNSKKITKNMIIIIAFCSFLILLGILYAARINNNIKVTKEAPLTINGVLNLENWDFDKDGVVRLDGNWEFYWDQLLEPKDFKGGSIPKMTGYYSISNYWTSYKNDKMKFPSLGYATYRAVIMPGEKLKDKLLAIQKPEIPTS